MRDWWLETPTDRVHNPPFTLMDQPEPDGQNSCAPATQSCTHPNLELGPFALCCFCLHSAFQFNTFSSNKCNFSSGAQMEASTSRTGVHRPAFSCCSCSLKANLSCRSAISFSTCLWVELCCLYRPAAACCHFGPVKAGPQGSGTGRSEASRSDCSKNAKLRCNLLRRQPQN